MSKTHEVLEDFAFHCLRDELPFAVFGTSFSGDWQVNFFPDLEHLGQNPSYND
jgi:hypothetical protein